MKEKDLIKLGFKKTDVTEEESGDKPYYYYTFDFFSEYCGLSLLSNSDDEVEDGKWFVTVLEENRIRFTNKKDLKKFIKLVKNNQNLAPIKKIIFDNK
jgi:hypothetical protein